MPITIEDGDIVAAGPEPVNLYEVEGLLPEIKELLLEAEKECIAHREIKDDKEMEIRINAQVELLLKEKEKLIKSGKYPKEQIDGDIEGGYFHICEVAMTGKTSKEKKERNSIMSKPETIRESVSEAYAKAVTTKKAGSGCCAQPVQKGIVAKLAGYRETELRALPADAVVNSFGCGNPVAFSDVEEGDVVLDLGPLRSGHPEPLRAADPPVHPHRGSRRCGDAGRGGHSPDLGQQPLGRHVHPLLGDRTELRDRLVPLPRDARPSGQRRPHGHLLLRRRPRDQAGAGPRRPAGPEGGGAAGARRPRRDDRPGGPLHHDRGRR